MAFFMFDIVLEPYTCNFWDFETLAVLLSAIKKRHITLGYSCIKVVGLYKKIPISVGNKLLS